MHICVCMCMWKNHKCLWLFHTPFYTLKPFQIISTGLTEPIYFLASDKLYYMDSASSTPPRRHTKCDSRSPASLLPPKPMTGLLRKEAEDRSRDQPRRQVRRLGLGRTPPRCPLGLAHSGTAALRRTQHMTNLSRDTGHFGTVSQGFGVSSTLPARNYLPKSRRNAR